MEKKAAAKPQTHYVVMLRWSSDDAPVFVSADKHIATGFAKTMTREKAEKFKPFVECSCVEDVIRVWVYKFKNGHLESSQFVMEIEEQ